MRRALLATALLLFAAVPAKADEIKLRADEWCPYNCSPGSDKPGFAIEIARAVFAPDTISYETLPWSRALAAAAAGDIDGAVGASVNEAPTLVFPENTLGPLTNVVATTKASSFVYDGVGSLGGKSLAAVRDYEYGPPIDDYIAAHAGDRSLVRLISGDDVTSQLVKMLIAGRADAIVEAETVLSFTAEEDGVLDQLVKTPLPADNDPDGDVNIGFTNNARGQALAKRFSDGLAALRASGELAKILARYGLTDWAAGQS